ncbi:MAG: 50S ribosomal protein L15 [Tenericutes bacterium HGW-Tenericutes-1]|jgi:large subunit ribosomal protein L15|nr:MAG: 50S ribosomal protein L15 [Tenericutes bacterium HGW-Tenericutes-1]
MKLEALQPVQGATHYKKRLGRGTSSGVGRSAGRGMRGQNSRTGGGVRLGFEGGQTPFFKRLPKRGFTNHFRVEYAVINVSELNTYAESTVVTPELLLKDGKIKSVEKGIKVLGNGSLNVKLTVQAHKFSSSAKAIIEAAGGTIEVI